jgi:hypothetical protein
MTDDIHPVVELLIARMESHPEEFKDDYLMSEVRPTAGSGRWLHATQAIQDHGSKRDVEALNAALSKIYMQYIHDWVMDELFNGDDRRREEEEVKKRLWTQQQQMHQQSPHLQSGMQNVSQLGSWQQAGLLGAASPPGEDSLMQQIRKRLGK